jgi:hypothetical protein
MLQDTPVLVSLVVGEMQDLNATFVMEIFLGVIQELEHIF